ncbi:hypothetical protein DUNSADRAFT_1313 [Dunaliella salina]|uniref:Uncharacterized protein n=1 Tax=Dunaliella salina TaxID=3046 RepID=A0ABQ7FXN4_DUNSA|nr:hypothetical protein DUNSADRAFT_1313 [Dunaliella salina]|eukprot:KAF5827107.1 hypothetical protein DUNSADRAFT_1313 [Dunaliella salina]
MINEKCQFAFDRYWNVAHAVTGFLESNLGRLPRPNHLVSTVCVPGCVQLIAWVTSQQDDPGAYLYSGSPSTSMTASAVSLPASALDMEQLCAALAQVAPGLPAHSVQLQFGLPSRFAPLPLPAPSHSRSTAAVDIVEILPPCLDHEKVSRRRQEMLLHIVCTLHEEMQPLRILLVGQHGELILEEDIRVKIQEESQVLRLRLPIMPSCALTGDRGVSTLRLLIVPALSGPVPRVLGEAKGNAQAAPAAGPGQPRCNADGMQHQEHIQGGQGIPQDVLQKQYEEWLKGGGPTPHLTAVSTPVHCTIVYASATLLVAPPVISQELQHLWQELLRAAHEENLAALQAIQEADGGGLPEPSLQAAVQAGAVQPPTAAPPDAGEESEPAPPPLSHPTEPSQTLGAQAQFPGAAAPATSPSAAGALDVDKEYHDEAARGRTAPGQSLSSEQAMSEITAPLPPMEVSFTLGGWEDLTVPDAERLSLEIPEASAIPQESRAMPAALETVPEHEVPVTAATWTYHYQQLIHDLAIVHAPGTQQQQPREIQDPNLHPVPGAFSSAGLESPALLDESEKHLLDYCRANAHLLPATLKLLSEERHPPDGWSVQPGRVMCSTWNDEKAS